MTSSGSDASVKALNPRRSQNAPSPPGGGLPKSSRAHPRSQKSPQTVDPLDCRDLLHDPLLKRTVLTPELVGLVLQLRRLHAAASCSKHSAHRRASVLKHSAHWRAP